jgi:hypothetical protein
MALANLRFSSSHPFIHVASPIHEPRMPYKIFRELPIVLAIALSGCAAIHAPTTEDQATAQRQPTTPQNVLVVSATQRAACSTCVPPTKLFVYSLKDSQSPKLVAAGSLKDSQGRSFEASRMRTDAQGNIFLVGGFLTYMGPSGLWQEKPGIAMLPARSLLSLDSFSTFDHGYPFDLAVDSRHRRLVATACRVGARMLSYDSDADELIPLTGDLPLPEPQCVFSRLEAVAFSQDGSTLYLLNGDLYGADITSGGTVAAFQHLAQAPPDDGHFYIGPEVFVDTRRGRFIVNLVDVSTSRVLTQFRAIDLNSNTNQLLYSTELKWDAIATGVLTSSGDRLIALERGWEPAWAEPDVTTKSRCILHAFNLETELIQHAQSGAFECTRALAVDQSGRFAYVGSNGRLGVFALEGDAFLRAEPIAAVPFEDDIDYDVKSLVTTHLPRGRDPQLCVTSYQLLKVPSRCRLSILR